MSTPLEESKALLREVLLAGGLVALLLGSMWLATGSFPPMVVVESGSMMHDLEDGSIGAIDPGDLILVMDPERAEIITYVEAKQSGNENEGYESHGMEGDVIVYRKNGGSDTPVIHRALLKAVAERTATPVDGACSEGVFDDLENICILSWSVLGTDLVDVEEISLEIDYECENGGKLVIDSWIPEHEGYLTSGDNIRSNRCDIDQIRATSPDSDNHWVRAKGLTDENGQPVTAVRDIWVEGIASSEIPWVGAIKLFLSGTSSSVTGQTWTNLGILIVVILAAPMLYESYIGRGEEAENDDIAPKEDDGMLGDSEE